MFKCSLLLFMCVEGNQFINLHLIVQHDVPHGKHALILVKQPKGNLVWISTQETANSNKMSPPASSTGDKDKKFEPRLKTWNDCDYIQVIKSAFKCTLLLLCSSIPLPSLTKCPSISWSSYSVCLLSVFSPLRQCQQL